MKVANAAEDVLVFNNGQEVVEALRMGKVPRIILLDINMPIMDGWEFLEEYQKSEEQADVYILTSSSNNYDLEKADGFSNVKGYYTKPINKDTINSILNLV
jgi:CheY-like chemotaxis protein